MLIKGTGNVVAVTNYFVSGNNTIDILRFYDGYEINLGDIFIGTEEKDNEIGSDGEDQALLGDGNDIILGFDVIQNIISYMMYYNISYTVLQYVIYCTTMYHYTIHATC